MRMSFRRSVVLQMEKKQHTFLTTVFTCQTKQTEDYNLAAFIDPDKYLRSIHKLYVLNKCNVIRVNIH